MSPGLAAWKPPNYCAVKQHEHRKKLRQGTTEHNAAPNKNASVKSSVSWTPKSEDMNECTTQIIFQSLLRGLARSCFFGSCHCEGGYFIALRIIFMKLPA